jgi:membrane associated rhomboid family serine protease
MISRANDGEDPGEAQEVAVFRSRVVRRAREYALVLDAVGIPYGLMQIGPDHIVAVERAHLERATKELREYERENRGWRTAEEIPLALTESWRALAIWSAVLLFAFALQKTGAFGYDWKWTGRSSALLVRAGEWWRTITALTLHADLGHVLSNVAFGALFLALACEVFGTGVGLFAVFASGAIGNYANAWIQGDNFSSIGASTAVFGALGLIGGHRWQRRRHVRARRFARWVPLIGAAALLLWLGTGGSADRTARTERIDVFGHLCGFAAGVVIGALNGRFAPRERLSRKLQIAFGVATLAAIAGAWALALSR